MNDKPLILLIFRHVACATPEGVAWGRAFYDTL